MRKRLLVLNLALMFLFSSCEGKGTISDSSAFLSSEQSASETMSGQDVSTSEDTSQESSGGSGESGEPETSSDPDPMLQRENPLVDLIDAFLDHYGEKGDPFNKMASAQIAPEMTDVPKFPECNLPDEATVLQKMYLLITETKLPFLIAGKSRLHRTNDSHNHLAWQSERTVFDSFSEEADAISEDSPDLYAGVRYIEFEDGSFLYNGDPAAQEWLDDTHEWVMTGMEGEGDSYHKWNKIGEETRYEMVYTVLPQSLKRRLQCTVYNYDRDEKKYYEISLSFSFSEDASPEKELAWMEGWLRYFGYEVPLQEFLQTDFSKWTGNA
ncbi:MAG: hypothetical protein J5379_02530 [Clostridiales bacterium]|nr:hypothetical protein [Clostridiales bacterium]